MDAVDAVLVDITFSPPRLIASSRKAWPAALRQRMHDLASGVPIDATGYAILDAEVGEYFAVVIGEMLRSHHVDPSRVSAIGCHGQTVAHTPDAATATTLQVADANVVAEHTGITTVNDFRRRDMAAGGQGAPLAPAFHAAFLRVEREDRVVLNLGGIANITVLPANPKLPVIGFDTGPANCLMDYWTREQQGRPFDRGGEWAASAAPDAHLLAAMHDDPYFAAPPPKSTGTQYFSADWLKRRLVVTDGISAAQVQATLLALSCQTIADAICHQAQRTARVLVCGGGVHNRHLLLELEQLLGIPVESTGRFGVDPDWMEAIAFAWLAHRTLVGKPGNLPSVTGASGPRILGAIHPA